jgi:hypothetical protein
LEILNMAYLMVSKWKSALETYIGEIINDLTLT